MRNDTLCWECANFAKCSWSKGVPVEGWDATPTTIISEDGEMHSYCVHSCPQFKEEAKRLSSLAEIAAIVSKSKRTVCRYLIKKKSRLQLRELLKGKGFKLHIYNDVCDDSGNVRKQYYLERIGGVNESS